MQGSKNASEVRLWITQGILPTLSAKEYELCAI